VTTQTLWIVVAVVVAILLIAVALGLVVRRQRRISLREPEKLEREPGTAPPRKGGTYQAGSGFSFTAGPSAPPGQAAPPPVAPPPDAPAVPPEAAPQMAPSAGVPLAPPEAAPPVTEEPTRAPAAEAAPGVRPPVAPAPAETAAPAETPAPPRTPARAETPAPAEAAAPAETPAPTETAAPVEAGAPTPTAPDTVAETARPEAPERPSRTVPTTPYPPAPPRADEPRSANGATPTLAPPPPPATAAPSAPAPATPAPATPAPAAPAAPTEAIEPPEGRLERLRGRLARSRSGFGQGLLGLLGAGELDDDSWEDVEATLLQADLGPEMTAELVETLRVELARRAVRTPAQARQLLRDVLTEALRPELDRSVRALPHDGRPAVLLVVGVNGTGKTTTTGKLARVLVAGGRHVVLGAADTFRAAAAEQLGTWGERAGATVVRGPEGADPASVAFDAVKQGADEGADAVLLDTAGRLHTKTGLMDELGKVKRVVSRQAEVDEVLLVLDATTGQNGLVQARVFGDVVDVSGIVLTKLDGTAKGGIVFRVQRELGVPVKLVGLGEGADDLAPFEPAAFVDALLT
jgi:fused signal recognition particle receptor